MSDAVVLRVRSALANFYYRCLIPTTSYVPFNAFGSGPTCLLQQIPIGYFIKATVESCICYPVLVCGPNLEIPSQTC